MADEDAGAERASPLGELEIWNYRYKDNPDQRMLVGIMAQDAKRVAPAVTGPEVDALYRQGKKRTFTETMDHVSSLAE